MSACGTNPWQQARSHRHAGKTVVFQLRESEDPVASTAPPAPGAFTARPYHRADRRAVLALIDRDRLPGQPPPDAHWLTSALFGQGPDRHPRSATSPRYAPTSCSTAPATSPA